MPVKARYLVKTLSGGLRVGADLATVEEAIAAAFGAEREAVARAHRDSGDIGETAAAARDGRLEAIRFRLFHPIGFMLASPIEDPPEVAAELSQDVVVTAVEQGNGKRAGMLSDYTFAVRAGDRLVNIGKAYSGLTDEEIRMLGARFRKITVARYGPVRAVAPEVVLEVAFDTIQKSARHKSGFALRFPRIVRIREDKRPDEADTVERVEEIWRGIQGA
jgi:ATP-dependent DNA ligase